MAQGSAEDFQAALDRIAGHLTSENSKDVAAATVTITLMLQNTQNMPADLAGIVERLVGLLESQELAIQRNAAAALAASLESSDTAVQAAIEHRVAEHAVTLLEGGVEDAGLQLNLLVLLGTLGEASGETAQLVLDAGGMEALLARADPQASEQLQEAAADGVCKLAANCAAAKDAAAAAGAIPRLAALLGGSADVCVRALLGLGMLVGGSPERQLELAAVPGAVSAILRLMRQQDDADVQQISAGLFKELATNAEAKQALGAALKEQQAADAAGAKYV